MIMVGTLEENFRNKKNHGDRFVRIENNCKIALFELFLSPARE